MRLKIAVSVVRFRPWAPFWFCWEIWPFWPPKLSTRNGHAPCVHPFRSISRRWAGRRHARTVAAVGRLPPEKSRIECPGRGRTPGFRVARGTARQCAAGSRQAAGRRCPVGPVGQQLPRYPDLGVIVWFHSPWEAWAVRVIAAISSSVTLMPGGRWHVSDGDGQAEFVGPPLKFALPQPRPRRCLPPQSAVIRALRAVGWRAIHDRHS